MSSHSGERKLKGHAFHIRIGNRAEKFDIKDPSFLKLLEQEYATKYLESLGVEATLKNINKILKENPIENCEILESRLNGGLYTDTITIIPKSSAEVGETQKNEKQEISNDMLQMLNLKRMVVDKKGPYGSNGKVSPGQSHGQSSKNNSSVTSNFRVKSNVLGKTGMERRETSSNPNTVSSILDNFQSMRARRDEQSSREPTEEKPQEGLKNISFEVSEMKARYIFPFNENFKRKSNYKLKDSASLVEAEDPKVVYEQKALHFPFTQVKLSLKTLKELQNPVEAKLSDICSFLESFYQEFPSKIFPLCPESSPLVAKEESGPRAKKKQESHLKQSALGQGESSQVCFSKKQIELMFEVLRDESTAKLIGVLLHLAYWCVFGGVNPIQIEANMKKKMYIMMFETLEYFQLKVENRRLWATLVFPMLLLCLKMALHYFYQLQYPRLFRGEEAKQLGVDELALDKLLHLADQLFDHTSLNGRFIFLESEITGQKGTFLKDKDFVRKRIFGTSPALQIILPNPQNGKTRSMLAKKLQHQDLTGPALSTATNSAFQNEASQEKQECQEKLLCLALHKINNRLEEIQGQGSNPIINLKA